MAAQHAGGRLILGVKTKQQKMFKDRKVKKAPSKGVNTILLKDSQVEEKKKTDVRVRQCKCVCW